MQLHARIVCECLLRVSSRNMHEAVLKIELQGPGGSDSKRQGAVIACQNVDRSGVP